MAKPVCKSSAYVNTGLLGRVTYQDFVGYWPHRTPEDEPFLAHHINEKPKLIFSKTLTDAPWGTYANAQVIGDDVVDEVYNLQQQPGKDMMIIGSISLVQSCTKAGLIDEYVLLVHPVFLGSGVPLFKQRVALQLVETKTFKNGVVKLTYHKIANGTEQ